LLSTQSYQTITRPIIIVGLFIGLILSWTLLSGDSQGRVNILYLIAIYVLLPIVSIVISLISFLVKRNFNLASLLSHIPLWSQHKQIGLLKQKQHPDSRLIFFYQSQLAAISFSTAGLVVFILLLLTTDINFVWRSTILDAEQIYPLLKMIAMPWQLIESAQPELSLLQATQDSRLNGSQGTPTAFGDWWQYILATQIFYAFLLRGVLLATVISALKIRDIKRSKNIVVKHRRESQNTNSVGNFPSPVTDIPCEYALNNWANLNDSLLETIQSQLTGVSTNCLSAGPLASHSEQLVSERWQQPQLVIVKGWEPPLAELSDFMQNGKGFLMPLDWDDKGIKSLSPIHLEEWQRFVYQLPEWQLITPRVLM
jgi:hypothetical protein